MKRFSFRSLCVLVLFAPLIAFAQKSGAIKPAKTGAAYGLQVNDTLRLATVYEPATPPSRDGVVSVTAQSPSPGFPQPALVPVSNSSIPTVLPAVANPKPSGTDSAQRTIIRQAVRKTAAPVPAATVDSAQSDLERLLNRKKRARY
nr:hypothetical protein [uncultured Arsenicibacter sp.]